MSIKPIDFHLTYANTVNESKTKQIDFNKMKQSNQVANQQQLEETQRNRRRIIESEESKGKTINKQDQNTQERSRGNDSSQGRRKVDNEDNEDNNEKTLPKNADFKGFKIDIMI